MKITRGHLIRCMIVNLLSDRFPQKSFFCSFAMRYFANVIHSSCNIFLLTDTHTAKCHPYKHTSPCEIRYVFIAGSLFLRDSDSLILTSSTALQHMLSEYVANANATLCYISSAFSLVQTIEKLSISTHSHPRITSACFCQPIR